MKTLDFYFDVVSPASYIAWTQLPGLTRRTGVSVRSRPVFLNGLLKAAGNTPPPAIPAKGRYVMMDLIRCGHRLGLPMKRNKAFPMNTAGVQRALASLIDDPRFDPLADAAFRAVWEQDRDVSDPLVMAGVAATAGLSPDEYAERSNAEASRARLAELVDEAASRGAFGAPTFYIGDEMFFGQDRLNLVEERLDGTAQF